MSLNDQMSNSDLSGNLFGLFLFSHRETQADRSHRHRIMLTGDLGRFCHHGTVDSCGKSDGDATIAGQNFDETRFFLMDGGEGGGGEGGQ